MLKITFKLSEIVMIAALVVFILTLDASLLPDRHFMDYHTILSPGLHSNIIICYLPNFPQSVTVKISAVVKIVMTVNSLSEVKY